MQMGMLRCYIAGKTAAAGLHYFGKSSRILPRELTETGTVAKSLTYVCT